MSNTVTFYKVTDDPIVINKTLGAAIDTKTNVKIKGDCSILSPTLVMKYDASIAAANYCYIDAPYNRYYYLAPPVLSPGGRMVFASSVDPLMSWATDIGKLDVIVSRKQREQYQNSDVDYIADTKAQAVVQPSVLTVKADKTPFDTNVWSGHANYVLTVAGGKKAT